MGEFVPIREHVVPHRHAEEGLPAPRSPLEVVQPMTDIGQDAIDVEDRVATHAPTVAQIDTASLSPWDSTTAS